MNMKKLAPAIAAATLALASPAAFAAWTLNMTPGITAISRRIYGLHETQFKTYFRRAAGSKGVTGTRLLQLLETRLDNVIYRLGLASSRKEARQMVAHGHLAIDGKRVGVPSYQVKPGQTVTAANPQHLHPRMKELGEAAAAGRRPPSWIEFDPARMAARVLALPGREEIDVPVQEQLIVEYYSR